jgi:hypothetical protein
MKSLFNQQNAGEFIERINKLTPTTKAQWGVMNVSQMLRHSQLPLDIASGALVPKVNPIVRFLFGKSAKKQINSDQEFKKNLPTFREGKIHDERDFEKEKTKLVSQIQHFQQKGEAGLTKDPHPFFGTMTVNEWDRLQVKHLDHHLKQFGV